MFPAHPTHEAGNGGVVHEAEVAGNEKDFPPDFLFFEQPACRCGEVKHALGGKKPPPETTALHGEPEVAQVK